MAPKRYGTFTPPTPARRAGLLPMVALVIPSGPTWPSEFGAHLEIMDTANLPMIKAVPRGALVAMNMREITAQLLALDTWERMLVLETDMIPPLDAFIKHAQHTAPIVGSQYFLHAAPHHLVAMRVHGEQGMGWMSAAEQREIIDNPGLHAVDMVGLGCTSIARDVLARWPVDQFPIFRNSFQQKAYNEPGLRGEVSHDVWFSTKAREMDIEIFIDSSIKCETLTTVRTSEADWRLHNGFTPTLLGGGAPAELAAALPARFGA